MALTISKVYEVARTVQRGSDYCPPDSAAASIFATSVFSLFLPARRVAGVTAGPSERKYGYHGACHTGVFQGDHETAISPCVLKGSDRVWESPCCYSAAL